MSLSTKLDSVLTQWTLFDPPVHVELSKGLSRVEIDEAMKGFLFRLPEDVYEIYMWHNGTANSSLLPDYYLMPLRHAIETYNRTPELFIDLVKEVQESGVLERKAEYVQCCFPLFFDAGGTLLTLPCSEQTQPGEPLIAWDENPPEIVYKDIQSLIDTVVTASRMGAYFLLFEGLNEIEIDMDKWDEAGRQCNPGVSYWLNS